MSRPRPPYRCFIGWDPAQMRAWTVAAFSVQRHTTIRCDVRRVSMMELRAQGLYQRPTGYIEHGYWDDISAAPMSTGHAIARFLVPHLCGYEGWALFTDGDVMLRTDVAALFALADSRYAVQVVQHAGAQPEGLKMTGAAQTSYARKNWSSVMLFNCEHPSNRALSVDLVNRVPGRDLHRFCWLADAEIGALPPSWNYLVGHTPPTADPALVHFTEGCPDLPGYEHVPFSDEWYAIAKACGYRLDRPTEARRA